MSVVWRKVLSSVRDPNVLPRACTFMRLSYLLFVECHSPPLLGHALHLRSKHDWD